MCACYKYNLIFLLIKLGLDWHNWLERALIKGHRGIFNCAEFINYDHFQGGKSSKSTYNYISDRFRHNCDTAKHRTIHGSAHPRTWHNAGKWGDFEMHLTEHVLTHGSKRGVPLVHQVRLVIIVIFIHSARKLVPDSLHTSWAKTRWRLFPDDADWYIGAVFFQKKQMMKRT